MSETENIAAIGNIISDQIFDVFGWQSVGPRNLNWECVDQEAHQRKRVKTHPSDVVFTYSDPYGGFPLFLNTDLKSYARDSITAAAVQEALGALAYTVDCAAKAPRWADHYAAHKENWSVAGLLFIYNHDGGYHRDFDVLLDQVKPGQVRLPPGKRIFVMGPTRIEYLNTIAHDISAQRGREKLPAKEKCGFYTPDLIGAKVRTSKIGPATVEMLLGPWQVLHFDNTAAKGGRKGWWIYYIGEGSSVDEFNFLLDYIFTYQLLGDEDVIDIRMPFGVTEAPAVFDRAKRFYGEEFWPVGDTSPQDFESRLQRVTCSVVTGFSDRFSEIEIGMKRR
ncbi:MAG: hypothetical protein DMF06_05565 [Verrucomicrobia bacterium]|nr:MAG: hypothetical protein DMF06_05565 [Verrucomicrobiota bacterium]